MRPETRPERPYTDAEILDRIEQHFVVEGNPRCVLRDTTGPITKDIGCVYGLTGCAVGCLLTQEDADGLDRAGSAFIEGAWCGELSRAILSHYISNEQVPMLARLQAGHDYPGYVDHREFVKGMATAIAREREQLGVTK